MTIGLGALLKALQRKYDHSALEAIIGEGKLWPWFAPQGQELPYITLDPGAADVEYTMGTSRMETIPVSFSIWLSVDTFTSTQVLKTTLEYAEALIALYDDCSLDFGSDDWSLIRMGRTGYFIGPDPDRGWQIRLDYECMIEEV